MSGEAVNLYVKNKVKQYRAAKTAAEAVVESKRDELRERNSITLTRDELYLLIKPNEFSLEFAYGLDEAMQALEFYADDNTWTEVPAKTFAAEDRGEKARVALTRIDPV